MPNPGFSLRIPPALRTLMEDHAKREGLSLGEVINETCANRFMGHDSAPAPRTKAAPKPKAPVAADPRQALAQTERRVGVKPAHLDTSFVHVHDGSKRPAYQKGQAGQGKGGRGR